MKRKSLYFVGYFFFNNTVLLLLMSIHLPVHICAQYMQTYYYELILLNMYYHLYDN